jgi:hypothetical protein
METTNWRVVLDTESAPSTISVVKQVDDRGGGGTGDEATGQSYGESRENSGASKITPSLCFPVNIVHGIPCPTPVTVERWDLLQRTIQYRPSDVLVSAFPKCGTTWIEHVVLLLLHGKNEHMTLSPAGRNAYRPVSNPIGKIWIEAAVEQVPQVPNPRGPEFEPLSMEEFDSAPGPRVIKTHAQLDRLIGTNGGGIEDLPLGAKIVCVSRNPLDACVSFYYHGWSPYKSGWPFEGKHEVLPRLTIVIVIMYVSMGYCMATRSCNMGQLLQVAPRMEASRGCPSGQNSLDTV